MMYRIVYNGSSLRISTKVSPPFTKSIRRLQSLSTYYETQSTIKAKLHSSIFFNTLYKSRRGLLVLSKSSEPDFPDVKIGGMQPEDKAADSLQTFFTMVAVRIVLDHMMGSRHKQPIYDEVVLFLQEHPLRHGHTWLQLLMSHDQHAMRMVAVRILEVRKVFAEQEFDWGSVEEAVKESLKDGRLMFQRDLLEFTFDETSFDEDIEEEGPTEVKPFF